MPSGDFHTLSGGNKTVADISLRIKKNGRCVVGNKAAVGMGDAISVVPNPADFGGKRDHAAKFPGYVVYVAYRHPFLF